MCIRFSPDNHYVMSMGGDDRSAMQWRVLPVAHDDVVVDRPEFAEYRVYQPPKKAAVVMEVCGGGAEGGKMRGHAGHMSSGLVLAGGGIDQYPPFHLLVSLPTPNPLCTLAGASPAESWPRRRAYRARRHAERR